jgi:hypothetical protein
MVQRELAASITSRLTAFIMDPTTSLNDLRAAHDQLMAQQLQNAKVAGLVKSAATGLAGLFAGKIASTFVTVALSLVNEKGPDVLQMAIDLLESAIKLKEKEERSKHLMENDASEASGDPFAYPFPLNAPIN